MTSSDSAAAQGVAGSAAGGRAAPDGSGAPDGPGYGTPGAAVTVVLPAALRDEAGGASTVQVVVPPPADGRTTVRHVLDALAAAHPRLERRLRDERGAVRRHVNVFVAGDDTRTLLGQDTPVGPGAEVLLLPNIAGG